MPDEDSGTIFINNDEANQVYRICINNGCTPDQANQIAIDIGKAQSKTVKGKLEADFKKQFERWGSGIITAILGAGTALILWFLDLLHLGGQ